MPSPSYGNACGRRPFFRHRSPTPLPANYLARFSNASLICSALPPQWGKSSSERLWECKGIPTVSPLRTRLVAARVTLRSRDPVEVRVRDAVLSEKEAQLGRM